MGKLLQGPWKPLTGRNLYILHLSRELGESTAQIREWMERGLPYDRDVSGNARFSLLEVLEWLDEQDERTT